MKFDSGKYTLSPIDRTDETNGTGHVAGDVDDVTNSDLIAGGHGTGVDGKRHRVVVGGV